MRTTTRQGRIFRILALCSLLFGLTPSARAQNHSLEVFTGLGTYGIVTAEPGNYTCNSHCTWSYPAGAAISLLPTAPAGETFLAWETCTGTLLSYSSIYTLTLNSDQCVQAYFTVSSGPYTLTVYKGTPGLANGSITGTGGFSCSTTAGSASQAFASGTAVTLTNSPATGWSFAYWEYNGVDYTNAAFTVTMDRDQLVQAVFIHPNVPPAVSIITPTNNAGFSVCSKTPIVVTASDPNPGGAITNIQLFLNSALVARGASSPLSFVVTNEAVLGTNLLVAEAADNFGLTNWSASVSFTVSSPGTNRLQVLGLVPTNAFEFCLCGLTSRVYAVQISSNLFQPWSPWEVVTNSSWGVLPVIDRSISNSPLRFYRAQLLP
jgi:Big-like domain-containing protein/List-Bact-rpt repeat protein